MNKAILLTKKLALVFVIALFPLYLVAEPLLEQPQVEKPKESVASNLDLKISANLFMYSPDYLYSVNSEVVRLKPKNSLFTGVRFVYKSFDLSLYSSLLSGSQESKSNGFSVSQSLGNYYVNIYGLWARDYTLESETYKSLGDRTDIHSEVIGGQIIKAHNSDARFENIFQPQYVDGSKEDMYFIYSISLDHTKIKGDSPLTSLDQAVEKDRATVAQNFGVAFIGQNQHFYLSGIVTAGVGLVQENQKIQGSPDKTTSIGALTVAGLFDGRYAPADNSYFTGFTGQVNVIAPTSKQSLTQQSYLVAIYLGKAF